ncbi:MAG TPA: Gfo/Idh/MocA family oxidoreductase [Ruania sp.]|nr:Gfo/Idh/MocA family oxidoreductase [Ruania sp.]
MNNEMGFHNEPGSRESHTSPLRVAVVGCGARSAIATLLPTGRAQVTALVDPQVGSRVALARQLAETATDPHGPADAAADAAAPSGGPCAAEAAGGAPAEFDTVGDLLGGAEVDAALVLTPDDTHAEVATTLLRAGVAVYLEKPMTITTGSADAVLSAAAESGSALYVGHNMRHMAVVRTMKEIIDGGQIGRVKAIWCRHFVGNGGDYYFKDWHAERTRSTGLLLQKGAHDIDVIHWLAGAYTERVSAMGGLTLYDQVSSRRDNSDRRMPEWFDRQAWPPLAQRDLHPVIDVEDLSMVHLQLAGGLYASYQQCHYTPDYWRNYTVIGTEGRLENFGDGPGGLVRVWNHRVDYQAEGDREYPITGDSSGHGDADRQCMAEFVAHVAHHAPTATSPVAARYAVAAGEAATRSLREGAVPQDVPPLPPGVAAHFDREPGQPTVK